MSFDFCIFCRWLISEIISHYEHIDQTLYLQFWWNERNVFALSLRFFPFCVRYSRNKQNERTRSLKLQWNPITFWPMYVCCTLSSFGSYTKYETYCYRKIDELKCKVRGPIFRCVPFKKSYSTEGTRCNAKCFIYFCSTAATTFVQLNGKHERRKNFFNDLCV